MRIEVKFKMKKVYTKPQIEFESFTLCNNIAAGCETTTNLPSANQCGMDFSGLVVFMTGMTGCTGIQIDNVGGDGEFNGICYHVPNGDNNLFTS